MKKIFALNLTILISIMLFSLVVCANGNWQSKYPWAIDAVNYCTANAIMEGDEYGDLMLGSKMTRGQMAKLISTAFSLDDSKSMPYSDVDKNSWEYPYISSIAEFSSPDSKYFDPTGLAKREDFIVIIMRVLKITEADESVLNGYSDVSKISSSCRGLVAAAIQNGVINGSDGNIKPRTSITRAEACVILHRAKNLNPSQRPTNKPQASPTDDENGYTENSYDTTIEGNPKITVEQAQAWAKERGGSEKYINIAPTYWYYGELMGIRPEILYAQAGWETNYGKYTGVVSEDMNNWAGIKVAGRNDDEKDAHETFATPEEGARGHFNHISAYIGVEPVGKPHDRYYSAKSTAWAGTVKTLEELGGKWCPDPEYGIKILQNCLIPMSNY